MPEGSNLSIPMYYSVSESIIRPEYNPLDPDVKMKDLLASDELTTAYKDSIRKITDDYTRRRSLNFTNVRKLPGQNKKKNHIYDIENFSFTYAYSEIFRRDINTKFDKQENYRGAINYNFSGKPKSIEPFKKNKFIRSKKGLKWLKDFNFNPVPNQISVQSMFDRSYQERKARNISSSSNSSFIFESPTFFQKAFNWSRVYTLRHNFTKSITFNFNASTQALIGEPTGEVDRRNREQYETFKRVVWENIKGFGDNTQYNHNFDLNYTLPLI